MAITVLTKSSIHVGYHIASQGSHSGIRYAKQGVIWDADELASFFEGNLPSGFAADEYPLYGIALGGRPTPGYAVVIREVSLEQDQAGAGTLTIAYAESAPPHQSVPQLITTSYALLRLLKPVTPARVVFRKLDGPAGTGPDVSHSGPSISDPNAAGDAAASPTVVCLRGTLTDEGAECQAFRDTSDRLYTLVANLGTCSTGDKVTLTGTVAPINFCQQGTTIAVSWIAKDGGNDDQA